MCIHCDEAFLVIPNFLPNDCDHPKKNFQPCYNFPTIGGRAVIFGFGWLVVLRINVDLAIFQPYLDLEAGDNQSLKIQVARPGIEPRSSCSASQELNHSATAAPVIFGMHTQIMNLFQ